MVEKLSLHCLDSEIEFEKEGDNKISVLLDSDFCAKMQAESDDRIYLKIKCVWDENAL